MKILVTGPLQCGKSSYVQFFDENAISIDTRSRTGVKTTVAMDFGVVKTYDAMYSYLEHPDFSGLK